MSNAVHALQAISPITSLHNIDLIGGYKTVDTISIDIETHTTPKPHWPGHDLGDFGLSVLSPPSQVSLWHPELPPVVLDFSDFDPYREDGIKHVHREMIAFLRETLCRPNLTTIGHNVIFDWRNLGVHFNLYIPLGARVWDTQIVAYRMGLGEQYHDKSPFGDSFALDALATRLGLLKTNGAFYDFYSWMKEKRANLSEFAAELLKESQEHIAWQIIGGMIPSNRDDLLRDAALRLIHLYVASDAALTYRIYKKQLEIATVLHDDDYTLVWVEKTDTGTEIKRAFKYQRYPELTDGDVNPAFTSQLDFLTRLLRVKCNQAIRGIPVDVGFLNATIAERKNTMDERLNAVLNAKDPHDPYPEFETIFTMMMYLNQVLTVCNELKNARGSTPFTNPHNWHFWKPVRIAREVIRDALSWSTPVDKQVEDVWVDFLHTTVFDILNRETGVRIRNKTIEAAPELTVPRIDLMQWVTDNCFIEEAYPYNVFLARVKTEWLTHYYTITRNDVLNKGIEIAREMLRQRQPTPFDDTRLALALPNKKDMPEDIQNWLLDVGHRATRERMVNMQSWTPYFMYCIAGAPLPSSDEFKYNAALTTKRFVQEVKAYRSRNNGAEPPNYQHLALEIWALSYGKGAMEFFCGEKSAYAEQTAQIVPLRELVQAEADYDRLMEIKQHSAFDGRVHPIVAPKARTGRMTSVTPNMQNLKMDSPTFIGIFVAPPGMTQVEIDLGSIEVAISNMTAGDHEGAKSREGTDLHMRRAEIYWSDVWHELDSPTRKKFRAMSKRVTFGDLYAAGPYLIATQIGVTMEEARSLMNKLHQALWRTEKKKKDVIANCVERFNHGYLPYVTTWAGGRIFVPRIRDWKNGNIKPMDYTTWNYVVQGGVPEMMGRAMVEASEWLEFEGYQTYIAHEVHDALIVHFDDFEYLELREPDIAVTIIDLMCNQVPEKYLRRTLPKTHVIASICPSNRFKWGFRNASEYPYPKTEYVNQWGRWQLDATTLAKDESDWEAPDWFGPLHEGWTLEAENEDLKRQQKNHKLVESGNGKTVIQQDTLWLDFEKRLMTLYQERFDDLLPDLRDFVKRLQMPIGIVYRENETITNEISPMLFPAWMQASHILWHRGLTDTYVQMLQQLFYVWQLYPEYFEGWDNTVFDVLRAESEQV